MKPEDSLKLMVMETASKTDCLYKRLRELVVILNVIYSPLISRPELKVTTVEGEYDFDDLLILIFELVQIMATFQCFNEAEKSLREFLTLHSSRLVDLCLEGRLNYINELIEFKRAVSMETSNQ